MALISQQVEISQIEARALIYETYQILCRPIDNDNKMDLFEALAYPYLKKVNQKLTRRITTAKPDKNLKITLTAQELLAIHQLVGYEPIELYNILSRIEQKVLNYDQYVNLY